jgi:hypothetical protein
MTERKEIVCGLAVWLLLLAACVWRAHHPIAAAPGQPPQFAPEVEKRIKDLRDRAASIAERAIVDYHGDDAAFDHAADESDKLEAEADGIEAAEIDKLVAAFEREAGKPEAGK